MSVRRVLVAVLWIASLMAATQFSAGAQQPDPGAELRFVQTGTSNGIPVGLVTAKIDGQWVTVQVQAQPRTPGLQPASK